MTPGVRPWLALSQLGRPPRSPVVFAHPMDRPGDCPCTLVAHVLPDGTRGQRLKVIASNCRHHAHLETA